MGGEIGYMTGEGDVMYRLALRHILVVQLADIPYAVRTEDVDLARSVTDDQLFAFRIVTDTGDIRSMQTGLTVVEFQLFTHLVHAVETAVRNGINAIL